MRRPHQPTPDDELHELLDHGMTESRFYLAEGLKRCDPTEGCGLLKDLDEFYTHGNGKGSSKKYRRKICKDCENSKKRPQSVTKVIRNRARNRAAARLIQAYPHEFAALLREEMDLARQEAELLNIIGKEHTSKERPVAVLKPGPARTGQTIAERLDVARCRRCHTHHDRGHRCPNCGSTQEESTDD